jgi:hypothetical protein
VAEGYAPSICFPGTNPLTGTAADRMPGYSVERLERTRGIVASRGVRQTASAPGDVAGHRWPARQRNFLPACSACGLEHRRPKQQGRAPARERLATQAPTESTIRPMALGHRSGLKQPVISARQRRQQCRRLGDCADESSKAGGPGTGWEPRGVRTTSFGPAAAVTVRAGNIRQARSRVRGRVRGQRDDDSRQKEGYSTSLFAAG